MANLSNINNVLRVSSNLRVGINTDAASYALEIGGTNSGIKLKNSGGSGKVYSILSDTSGNFQIYDDAAASGRLVINDIGNATFAGGVTGSYYIATNFINVQVDDAEVYWTNTANNDYWVWKRDASNNFILDHYNGSATSNALTFNSSQNATFAGNIYSGLNGMMEFRSSSYNNRQIGIDSQGFYVFNPNAPSGGRYDLKINDSGNATFAGNVNIGTALITPNTNFDNLVISQNGNSGITILSNSANDGGIYFGDENSNNRGQIKYLHASNSMTFTTDDEQRLTIDSSGNVGIANSNPSGNAVGENGKSFIVGNESATSESASISIISGSGGYSYLLFGDGDGFSGYQGQVRYQHSSNNLQFVTGAAEKMRITSAGQVNIYPVNDTSEAFRVFRGTGAYASQSISIDAKGGDANIRLLATDTYRSTVFYRSVDGGGNFTESMRINNAGNVGINTTSPNEKFEVKGNIRIDSRSKAGSGEIDNITFTKDRPDAATGTYEMAAIRSFTTNGYSGGMTFYAGRHTGGGAYALIPIMTIGHTTEIGLANVGIGTTAPTEAQLVSSYNGTVNNGMAIINTNTGTLVQNLIIFKRGTAEIGSISSNNTTTAYNTTSDYRLKENVVEMTDALDRVSQLKPSRFNFIADADKTVDGFLAHEVQEVVPEAITGEKDAVDEEGDEKYQGIDQSKLVPLLVGAIQELKAEIEILKNK